MKMNHKIIASLPKIELHLHLDCSLSFDVVKKLRPDISEREYIQHFIAPEKCTDLAEFLKYTSSGIELMQMEEQLRKVVKDIPRTAHAGEARGAESVWETLVHFKPQRIGHGVRSAEDKELIEFLVKNEIHLEICPTSNIKTDIYKEYSDHPIDFLFKSGVSRLVLTPMADHW